MSQTRRPLGVQQHPAPTTHDLQTARHGTTQHTAHCAVRNRQALTAPACVCSAHKELQLHSSAPAGAFQPTMNATHSHVCQCAWLCSRTICHYLSAPTCKGVNESAGVHVVQVAVHVVTPGQQQLGVCERGTAAQGGCCGQGSSKGQEERHTGSLEMHNRGVMTTHDNAHPHCPSAGLASPSPPLPPKSS